MTTSTSLRYQMCSLIVDSALALDELETASPTTAPDCRLDLGSGVPECILAWVDAQELRNGFIASEDDGGHLIVHMEDVATAVVTPSNDHITVYQHTTCAASVVHIVVDHVIPRLLARRGFTVLHATCVALGSTAIGFVGPSGAGKSTLALSLALAGADLLADDCLVLDATGGRIDVLRSYAAGRLRDDSAAVLLPGAPTHAVAGIGKQRVTTGNGRALPARYALGALIVLDRHPGDEISLTPLEAADAFWRLGAHAYVFDRMHHGFDGIGDVVDATPVYCLRYPSAFDRLPDVQVHLRHLAKRTHAEEVN